jgi:hypothetical protein
LRATERGSNIARRALSMLKGLSLSSLPREKIADSGDSALISMLIQTNISVSRHLYYKSVSGGRLGPDGKLSSSIR